MVIFTAIGIVVFIFLCVLVMLFVGAATLNMACGLLGALRIYRLAETRPNWRGVIKMAIRNWSGQRFNGDTGTYYEIGNYRVSPDIRDPLY